MLTTFLYIFINAYNFHFILVYISMDFSIHNYIFFLDVKTTCYQYLDIYFFTQKKNNYLTHSEASQINSLTLLFFWYLLEKILLDLY